VVTLSSRSNIGRCVSGLERASHDVLREPENVVSRLRLVLVVLPTVTSRDLATVYMLEGRNSEYFFLSQKDGTTLYCDPSCCPAVGRPSNVESLRKGTLRTGAQRA
jgi:hypothetical protein